MPAGTSRAEGDDDIWLTGDTEVVVGILVCRNARVDGSTLVGNMIKNMATFWLTTRQRGEESVPQELAAVVSWWVAASLLYAVAQRGGRQCWGWRWWHQWGTVTVILLLRTAITVEAGNIGGAEADSHCIE